MDSNAAQAITPEYREKIYQDLAKAMLAGLEFGHILTEDSEDSSEFILSRLDTLQTREELIQFLSELSQRWPVYADVYKAVAGEDNQQQITSIQDSLQQLTN